MSEKTQENKLRRKKLILIVALAGILLAALLIWRFAGGSNGRPAEGDPAEAVPTAEASRESWYPEEPEISGETYPTELSNGQFFGLRGTIVCRYPLTEIRGTVTNRVTGEVLFDVPVYPNATSYKIGDPTSETINDRLEFNNPACSNSWLNYRLTALYQKDGETLIKVLIDRNFKVGTPMTDEPEE